jgi:hypothetical protein
MVENKEHQPDPAALAPEEVGEEPAQDQLAEAQTLEEFLAGAPAPESEQVQLTRRRFLGGAVAGGAAGLAVAAGTGAAVWKVMDSEMLSAEKEAADELRSNKEAAAEELAGAQRTAEIELERVLGLVKLYEQLEKIGIDAILETGMAAVALPLGAVEAGAKALKSGLDWAEDTLLTLADALPTARESLAWLEDRVSALADGISRVEGALGRALDRATDNRIVEAMEEFANKVLDNLPFGLGDKFRDGLEGLVTLVTSVDDLVRGINSRLIVPLQEDWFSDEEARGLGGTLVDPLVEHVLDPLEAHLVNLSILADNWQAKLMEPTNQALKDRAQVKDQIARYKQDHGFS